MKEVLELYVRNFFFFLFGIESLGFFGTLEYIIIAVNFLTMKFLKIDINSFPIMKRIRVEYPRFIAKGFLAVAGVRTEYEGLEDFDTSKPTILMFTHASTLDVVATQSNCEIPLNFVAKDTLFKIPFYNVCSLAHGDIPIVRGKLEDAKTALRNAALKVKDEKKSIVISPEGTRRRKKSTGTIDQLLPFKKGPFHLAKDSGASITPLVYMGASRLSINRGLLYKRGTV